MQTTKLSNVFEPQNPTLNPPYNSIDHIYPNPCDVGLHLIRKMRF
jgi:hypothetical protein